MVKVVEGRIKIRRKKSELLQFSAFGNSENLCGQINRQYNFAGRTPTLCEGNCPPAPPSSDGPAILEDRSSLGILQPTAVIKRFVRWRIKSFYGDWNDGDPPEKI